MPSPFPGMDPWLEQHWGDVHTSIVTYCRDHIQRSLPRDLRARVEERVYLEDEDWSKARQIIPDVHVVEYPHAGPRRAEDGGVATLVPTEPIVMVLEEEPVTERFIEIRDFSSGGRLVTVIEVLSVTNKETGRGRELYLKKRDELDAAGVHLVEIDLLRQGEPVEIYPRASFRGGDTPYFITVYRQQTVTSRRHEFRQVRCEMYPATFQTRLPVIRIPLRPGDEDVLLDIQQLVNDAYDRGGYDILDYSQPPKPPLREVDAAWVAEWVKGQGGRMKAEG